MHTTKRIAAPALTAMAITGLLAAAPPAAATGNEVVFEAFGPGRAMTIDTDPSNGRLYDVARPWRQTTTIDGAALLQVVVVGDGVATPGCRITVNNVVVA